MTANSQQPQQQGLEVNLPAGGKLHLWTPDEVEMWEQNAERYIRDYRLTKQNDLVLLGAILTQNLALFRAQQRLNGMEPEFDQAGIPTGRIKKADPDPKGQAAAQGMVVKASTEIRELEKALGIDKKTREAGGAFSVADYITTLKKAGHEFGVHISKRVKAYEEFAMEMRWKLRLLRNGDAEDRQYHDISPEKIIDWAEEVLKELEEIDKKYAKEKGRVFVGKL